MKNVMAYAFEERKKALRYLAFWTLICFLILWIILLGILPLSYCIGNRFSADSLKVVSSFFEKTLHNPFNVWIEYGKWLWNLWLNEPKHFTWASFFMWRLPLLPTLAFFMAWVYFLTYNPYDYSPQYFGSGGRFTHPPRRHRRCPRRRGQE